MRPTGRTVPGAAMGLLLIACADRGGPAVLDPAPVARAGAAAGSGSAAGSDADAASAAHAGDEARAGTDASAGSAAGSAAGSGSVEEPRATPAGATPVAGTPSTPSVAKGSSRRTLRAAPLQIGQPTMLGDLDPEIVQRHVARQVAPLTACYEVALADSPTLRGTVKAMFMIGPAGNVLAATADGVRPDVASCVASVLKTIPFPKPMGASVRVEYRFGFAPAR